MKRTLRIASMFGLTLALGCGEKTAPPASTARAPLAPSESAISSCTSPEGQKLPGAASVRQVMRQAINPWLTRISFLLFHDPRPTNSPLREQDIAQSALALRQCVDGLTPRFDGTVDRHSAFRLYASLQAHNLSALANATLQHDQGETMHWYQHIKETCQSCHEQTKVDSMAKE